MTRESMDTSCAVAIGREPRPLGKKRTVVPSNHLKGQDDEQQPGQRRNEQNQSANAEDKE